MPPWNIICWNFWISFNSLQLFLEAKLPNLCSIGTPIIRTWRKFMLFILITTFFLLITSIIYTVQHRIKVKTIFDFAKRLARWKEKLPRRSEKQHVLQTQPKREKQWVSLLVERESKQSIFHLFFWYKEMIFTKHIFLYNTTFFI